MVRMLKSAALAAALAFTALQADANPSGEAHYTVSITGWVPVICRATLNQTLFIEDEDIVDLGQLDEFCNASQGYQVWIDSTPGVSGTLYVDGQEISLSTTGTTLISTSPTAAKRSRHLALSVGDSPLASLSIRVVAL